jgi:hypothetical protein
MAGIDLFAFRSCALVVVGSLLSASLEAVDPSVRRFEAEGGVLGGDAALFAGRFGRDV